MTPQLTILEYPDRRLRIKAKPVTEVTDALRALAEAMLKMMYDAKGVGLSATQVNIHKRLIVLDVSDARDQPMVLINPQIKAIDETRVSYAEGCLSVPGLYEDVMRPKQVKVDYLDAQSAPQSIVADGLLGVCIQHERDHLDGKLFVDYLSSLKRERIIKKMAKRHGKTT